jgi:hypothetical protein
MLKMLVLFARGALAVVFARWGLAHVWSFQAQRPADYADEGPAFDIREALNGPILSEGVIYDFTGRVNVRFVAEMHGTWDGDKGVLTEDFRYSSGRVQRREWTLEMGEDGAFTTTAPDIVGVGQGQQMGAAVRLTYRIRLEPEAGGHVLDVTDWMYLMENGAIMNRSEFRKFGVKVGELVATMRKAE